MSAQHHRVLSQIVTLITPDEPGLDGTARNRVHEDVTRFVASQVQGMPSFLRLPYKLALSAFNWLPLVRYGRPFLGLDRSTQAAYVSFWTDSKISVFRDFLKLIRSCALLAYFDHELVMDERQSDQQPAEEGSVAATGL